MAERLTSTTDLDQLFDTVFDQVHRVSSLIDQAQGSGSQLAVSQQIMLLLDVQSRLLLAMYSEITAARRDRRGDQTSSRPGNGHLP